MKRDEGSICWAFECVRCTYTFGSSTWCSHLVRRRTRGTLSIRDQVDFWILGCLWVLGCWDTIRSDYGPLIGLGLLGFGSMLGFGCSLGIGPLFGLLCHWMWALAFGPIEGRVKGSFAMGFEISWFESRLWFMTQLLIRALFGWLVHGFSGLATQAFICLTTDWSEFAHYTVGH